jgi:hypothetical protein
MRFAYINVALLGALTLIIAVPGISISDYHRLLFIHHSVGERLIADGNVRWLLKQAGYQLWDQGFTHPERGLHGPEGKPLGSYQIPDDNTRPYGFAKLFAMHATDGSPFREMLANHDVIMFKSCFPVSKIFENNIILDTQKPWRRSLDNYRKSYLEIRKISDQYPDKIFIIVTQPPLHPLATTVEEGKRARQFVEWIQSDAYLGNRNNLFVFDLFMLLADTNNVLRSEYRLFQDHPNSHPNSMAYMQIGPRFVDFVINTIKFRTQKSDMIQINFAYQEWPYKLIRSDSSRIAIRGSYVSTTPVSKLVWSDLDSQTEIITPPENFIIDDLKVQSGVNQFIFTAFDKDGRRSSAAIGFEYYPLKPEDIDILQIASQRASLEGLEVVNSVVNTNLQLIIHPKDTPVRAIMRNVAIDISEFDPQNSYFEIAINDGSKLSKMQFIFKGLGPYYFKSKDKIGRRKIRIPLTQFKLTGNRVDDIIIKGTFNKNDPLVIDSFQLKYEG